MKVTKSSRDKLVSVEFLFFVILAVLKASMINYKKKANYVSCLMFFVKLYKR